MKTHYQKQKNCTLDGWAGSWTLVAVNELGQHNLTDSAELSHRGELLLFDQNIEKETCIRLQSAFCCVFLQISDLDLSVSHSAPSKPR